MPLPRLLTLIFGLTLILGLMIWLIDSLSRLSWQLAYYPLLGPILIFLIIALLGVLIAAFVYYFFWLPRQQQQRKRSRRTAPRVSPVKAEAAEENLKAVRQQLKQIQDEVTRREMLTRSREIEQNLARGELMVVVFGTGSSAAKPQW